MIDVWVIGFLIAGIYGIALAVVTDNKISLVCSFITLFCSLAIFLTNTTVYENKEKLYKTAVVSCKAKDCKCDSYILKNDFTEIEKWTLQKFKEE